MLGKEGIGPPDIVVATRNPRPPVLFGAIVCVRVSSRYTDDRRNREEDNVMAKGYFMVRAEVPHEADRAPFDHWYATDHLPLAVKTFAAQRGWRCWSRSDPAVHYAFYEFADVGLAQALLDSEQIKPLVADFDRVWSDRVARRREILELVQEMTP